VRQLAAAARAFARGDPTTPLPTRAGDNSEIDTLIAAFSEMRKAVVEREEALRGSEQRLSMHVRQTPLAVVEWDLDFRVTDWNPSAESIFGYTREEALGRRATDLILPEAARPQVDELWHAMRQERGGRRSTNENLTKDGHTITCEWYNTPLVDEKGNVVSVASLALDITDSVNAKAALMAERASLAQRVEERTADLTATNARLQEEVGERQRAEEALRKSEAEARKLSLVASRTNNLVVISDPLGRVEWVNEAFTRISGYTLQEMWGKTPGSVLQGPDTDPATVAYMRSQLRQQQGFQCELLNYAKSGRPYWLEIEVQPAYDGQGKLTNFIAIESEITERRRARAALEERTAELRTANVELGRALRLKDEFLANMSHELRTPLNAVLGLSEALLEETRGPLNAAQAKSLRSIEESGRHLLSLINDILDLSKIEAGKLELQFESVQVETICQASLQFVKQAAMKKHLRVGYRLDDAGVRARCDSRRLKQILVNLLSNAVKFTPEGGQVGLDVSADAGRQRIVFAVWDTGIGIAEQDMPQLFKPFTQIDSSLSRRYEGTGLGLALVGRLTELHGGSISLESQPGQGSRFVVELPWDQDGDAEAQPAAEPAGAPQSAAFHQVLVIEDTPSTAEQLTRHLNALGVQAELHPRGEGALEQVAVLHPDVVLLDLLLPNVSGWEVLTGLKADPRTAAIPVIVISVLEERTRALAMGAAEYLVKPISRQALSAALDRVAHQQAPVHKAVVLLAKPKTEGERPLILLAEDNEASIHAVVDYLDAHGYRVCIAHDGTEAVALAQSEQPALILMDIQMPGMDGLEATRRIRADRSQDKTPIIALTALAMPGDRERCLAAGADDYLSKPVSLRALTQTIETHLARPRA
jgi:PAS domain S-box-containing protein